MIKQRYISPATKIVQMWDLEHSVLGGSDFRVKLKVDPVQEKYYDWKGEQSDYSDYLIEL